MLAIDVLVPDNGPRLWQKVVVDRLRADGHDVAVVLRPDASAWPLMVNAALGMERRVFRRNDPGLASPAMGLSQDRRARPPQLVLDLTGKAASSEVPTISLVFDGSTSDIEVAAALSRGRLPEVEAVLDGQSVVARALPMVDKRESTALGSDDVFARAVTLLMAVVRDFGRGRLTKTRTAAQLLPPTLGESLRFAASYLTAALPRLGREAIRRTRFRHAHWRVGYRFIDGPGVAEAGRLGDGWSVLADSGDHFYADPFAFQRQGRSFIFVEDYPHATGKGVISVVEFDATGAPLRPRPVLEEDFHLSYPQVFERDGTIWMLPEASAGGKLTLYRAGRFPDGWVADSVLVEGREISDATLLEHGGRLWLVATDRDSYGSTSDTMVVFHAAALSGPWTPHPMNPILIDRRRARPGGAFARVDGRIILPVQDGTLGYGGGLGLSEVLELTPETVRISEPKAIATEGDWPYPRIHTLNRSGRLEVIDGIAAVRKRSGPED